jgi:hypothetical protein
MVPVKVTYLDKSFYYISIVRFSLQTILLFVKY